MILRTVLCVSVLALSGCGTIFPVLAPKVDLQKDGFQGQALWDSEMFPDAASAEPDAASAEPDAASAEKVSLAESPNLYLMLTQIDSDNENTHLFVADEASLKDEVDKDPLPALIAKQKLTGAVVRTLALAQLGHNPPVFKLSSDDFRDFEQAVKHSNLSLFQSKDGTAESRKTRLAHLSSFVNNQEVTFEGILFTYMAAYYQGKFVDRSGGEVSKPKLGYTISNETITGALTVGMEALVDYAAYNNNKVKWPIVWEVEAGKRVYRTAKNNEPTFIDVLRTAQGKAEGEEIEAVAAVAEEMKPNGEAGITKKKLKLIAFSSGAAGDAGGSAADLITRTFGGGTGGPFVLFAKISIGDNDTLAKVVQTTVDTFVTRTTEAAVSTLLYDATPNTTLVEEPKTVLDVFGY